MDVFKDRNFYFFQHSNASLHYSVYGKGPKALFCFHGFGLSGSIFHSLEELSASEYTIYNFDLPFHGKSKWREGEKPIEEVFWKEWLTQFCKEKNITSFSMMGYSIGARLIWTTVLAFPDRVEEVIVMAPDGVKNSFWYTLATGTRLSRILFKVLLIKNHIQFLLKVGRFFHFAPKLIVRFAESQLITVEQRIRVYYTWITFRKLQADPIKISSIINEHKIKLTIFLGAQDRIITYRTIQPLAERLNQKNAVITLQSGHSNLVNKVWEYRKMMLSAKS